MYPLSQYKIALDAPEVAENPRQATRSILRSKSVV